MSYSPTYRAASKQHSPHQYSKRLSSR